MRNSNSAKLSVIALCSAALLSACGSADGWKKMSVDGATVSFEMPEPIKQQVDEQNSTVAYFAEKPEEKLSFRVGITKRNYEADQKTGESDEQILTKTAQRLIQANTQQFQQMGMPTQFQFNGKFDVPDGLGQQYQAKVGKAIVLDRFYINKTGIYYVEVTTQNPDHPDVKRFLNSFTP